MSRGKEATKHLDLECVRKRLSQISADYSGSGQDPDFDNARAIFHNCGGGTSKFPCCKICGGVWNERYRCEACDREAAHLSISNFFKNGGSLKADDSRLAGEHGDGHNLVIPFINNLNVLGHKVVLQEKQDNLTGLFFIEVVVYNNDDTSVRRSDNDGTVKGFRGQTVSRLVFRATLINPKFHTNGFDKQ